MLNSIEDTDFTSVFGAARKLISEQLAWLDLSTHETFRLPERMEIFTHPEQTKAIIFRILPGLRYMDERYAVEFLIVADSGEGIAETEALLRNTLSIELNELSMGEAHTIARLSEQVGKRSPNGKLLADKAVRELLRNLYDDELRSDLGTLLDTFSDTPADKATMLKLQPFDKHHSRLDRILNDEELVQTKYIVYCPKCDTHHLSFNEQSAAEATIANKSSTCAACNTANLEVLEVYSVVDALERGIKQGLWLESLASDIIREYTNTVWTGQMIRTNEIDVLAVFSGQTLLVECKDTSFGQNDLYVTSVKAQEINANIVLIITTSDIHQNVADNVERMTKDNNARHFHVISRENANEIRDELRSTLSSLYRRQLLDWFEDGLVGRHAYAYR